MVFLFVFKQLRIVEGLLQKPYKEEVVSWKVSVHLFHS